MKTYKAILKIDGVREETLIPEYSGSIEILLPNDKSIEIEFFDRGYGNLTVRTSKGSLVVFPKVCNVIEVNSI